VSLMFLSIHTRVFMTAFNVSQVCHNTKEEVAEFSRMDANMAHSSSSTEAGAKDLRILRYV